MRVSQVDREHRENDMSFMRWLSLLAFVLSCFVGAYWINKGGGEASFASSLDSIHGQQERSVPRDQVGYIKPL